MRSEELPVQHFLCPWVRKRCSYSIFCVPGCGKDVRTVFFLSWYTESCRLRTFCVYVYTEKLSVTDSLYPLKSGFV